MGFLRQVNEKDTRERLRGSIEESLKKSFRPEFLNRIDEIVVFDAIERKQLLKIVDIMVSDIQSRMEEHGIDLILTEDAKAWLANEGFDEVYGARPLRRTIQRFIENPLSTKIIRGDFKDADSVLIDLSQDELQFSILE
ncbi:uncharacterized protein METZ01_LOCUS149987 [marine metagenome]|uniref:Clp ATPase C-terminal domain-containing protein n=1 Tax=marine metagenome TaxID=408172 RepID=A0A382A863_9ZZZZ